MFHQSVADRLGLNVTDHKCLDFLILYGPSTAGELSERSSLTTGAITAVLDRLERAGFVRREADPSDRRRVIAHPVFERLAEIGELFEDLANRVQELSAQYTKTELAVIADFMHRTCDVLHTAAINLRSGQTEPKHAPAKKKSTSQKVVTRKPPNK